MKLQPFLIVLAACALATAISCRKEKDPVTIQPVDSTPFNATPMQFDNLEVGQGCRYLELNGENYNFSNDSAYIYTDDTLTIKIVGEDALGFKIEERLNYVGDVDDWQNITKDEIYTYYWKIESDSLFIFSENNVLTQSRIFGYFYGKKSLPLATITSPLLRIKGWKTNLSYCECDQKGYMANSTILGKSYPQLNALVSNKPMSYDGFGETWLFSAEHGIVRFTTYNWWTQTGFGWDLIP